MVMHHHGVRLTHQHVINSGKVLVENGKIFLLVSWAHLYGLLVALYGFFKLLLLVEFVTLLFNGPCLFQC